MTPRAMVGTTKSSSCACPGASAGSTNRAADSPTGSSTRIGSIGARASFVTAIRPVAGSPTTTRRGSTSASTRTLGASHGEQEAAAKRTSAARRHHEQLGPPPPRADEPGREAEREDRPAQRRDPGDPPTTRHAGRAHRGRRPPAAQPAHPATRRVDPGRERAQRHTESAFVAGLLAKLASRHRLAHADARSAGGAMSPRIWSMTWSTVAPANCASALSSRRCESTGSARILMSSGMT